MIAGDVLSVNKAFSRQSSHFDEDDISNPILQWMRKQVREHVLQYLKPNSDILELNAGTGLDAVFFAERSHSVTATDVSDGMITELNNKVLQHNLQSRIKVKQLSYANLQPLYGNNYDHIFSNFGGLNCIDDLSKVTRHFKYLLKPNGYVTFVIMQPVCPWEIITALQGNFSYAFRRLRNRHTIAHLEGYYFDTWYFSPRQAIKSFGKNFKKVQLRGLATLVPPPEKNDFVKRYPKAFRLLSKSDETLCTFFPFNTWGDHFILTMQFTGENAG